MTTNKKEPQRHIGALNYFHTSYELNTQNKFATACLFNGESYSVNWGTILHSLLLL